MSIDKSIDKSGVYVAKACAKACAKVRTGSVSKSRINQVIKLKKKKNLKLIELTEFLGRKKD